MNQNITGKLHELKSELRKQYLSFWGLLQVNAESLLKYTGQSKQKFFEAPDNRARRRVMNNRDSSIKPGKKKNKSRAKVLRKTNQVAQNHGVEPTTRFISPRDDLTSIEGIDPTIEMALNSMGIRCFSDFQGHTPESLVRALQERGVDLITAAKIAEQDWIGWAALYVEEIVHKPTAGPAERAHATDTKAMPAQEVRSRQTEQTDSPIPRHATELHEKNKRVTSSEIGTGLAEQLALNECTLRIDRVQFTQIEAPEAESSHAAKGLGGEILCTLTGSRAEGQQLLCTQVHAEDMLTGAHLLLASHYQHLLAGQLNCRVELRCEIPGAGRYQLYIVVFLVHTHPAITFHQGPFLRVVP